jgi:hypothetical protein
MGESHPKIEPALGRAEKYGRRFLQHIPAALAKMEAVESSTSKESRIGLAARKGRKAMQSAAREMQNLLALFDPPTQQCNRSWHDQARLIASTVRRTLEETTGKRLSRRGRSEPFVLHRNRGAWLYRA